jgi:hypothetical protein
MEHAHARGDRHRQLPGRPFARPALPHDGRFPTLDAVIAHYDSFFALGLTPSEKRDLAEFLKSL